MGFDDIDRQFRKKAPEPEPETDDYGNPIDGDRLIYCCYPDCGYGEARLCMAENGASEGSMALNRPRKRS